MRGVDNQIIGRGDRGFVARDYWLWPIFGGLQNLVEKVEKKWLPF
jgi:ABC-type arginine transport system ATPase subunit